ncbi:MAG: penicillin acylase family protein [Ignavibacteria bacterium]
MNKVKIFTGVFIVLILLIIFSVFFVNRIIKKSYPQTEGEISLNGIKSEIKIYRDNFGIPYIEAENEDNLFFALGFVHAQDRLFQMDITRRAGMGRLAEILGSNALEFDLVFRTTGFDEIARKLFENASPLSKKICKSYTDGINAYLEFASGNFSIEFDLLNYQPEKWEPYQVYLIARLTAWELNLGWWVDVVYAQLQNKLPPEKLLQLIPDYPDSAPTIIHTKSKLESHKTTQDFSQLKINNLSNNFIELLNQFYSSNIKARQFLGISESYSGSNSWAISGKLSKTGKPILANDPHLMYSVPSKWYLVSLNSPTLKVSGVTIPGSPSVVIGKNENIAWGLTNLMLDDCDFFIEKLDSTGTKYFFNNEWKDLAVRIDTIKVKDSSDFIIRVKSTHRGPLIQSANKFLAESNFNETISMKWTGFELSDELLTFYKINKAKNYKEFREALKTFNCPAQNFLCADVDGNIFYKAGGKIPFRNYSNFIFPLDGTVQSNDWNLYLNFDSQPEILNPETGFIATNNNPPNLEIKNLIGNLWEPHSRAERINQLLKNKNLFSVDDFKKFQMDLNSPFAKDISTHIVKAFNNFKIKNPNLDKAISLFKNWDGELRKYDPISLVYNVFLINLMENTFKDEMGDKLYKQFLFVGNVPLRTIHQLLNKNYSDSISIFDDIQTEKIETKDEIIRKSLAQTISELEKKYGQNFKEWSWGKVHNVKFRHLFSGQSRILDKVIDIGPYPIGGDQTTLLNTSFRYYEPFENFLGPSMRQIVDLSNIDSSWIIITNGQSEHIGHKNYKDQSVLWLNGEYINFKTNKSTYGSYKVLILKPIN